jgi:hypothetical protein
MKAPVMLRTEELFRSPKSRPIITLTFTSSNLVRVIDRGIAGRPVISTGFSLLCSPRGIRGLLRTGLSGQLTLSVDALSECQMRIAIDGKDAAAASEAVSLGIDPTLTMNVHALGLLRC